MSKSPRTPSPPAVKSSAALNRKQRAWIDSMLSLLSGSQQAGASGGGTAGQSVLPIGFSSRVVAQAAPSTRIPSPSDAARQHEVKRENEKKPTAKDDDTLPALEFPKSKSAVRQDDVRVSPNAPYEKLPNDIKQKMSVDVWQTIAPQRATLIETYLRLSEYGIWDEVARVTGIQEKLPAHGKLGPVEVKVHGTGGIAYEASSASRLIAKLIGTRHFGKDNAIMSAMHAGQISLRESREEAPPRPVASLDGSIHEWDEADKSFTSTSLHISVGPRNHFDAHIDSVSPVMKPIDGQSVPHLVKGSKHFSKEVIAAKFGGFAPYITIEENKEGWHGGEGKVTIEGHWEWDFPSGKKPQQKLPPKQREPHPADEDVQAKIAKRVERTKNYFKIPVGTRPDEVPEPKAVATKMAAKMLESAEKKNNTVVMDVPFYLDKKEDQQSALDMMQEIGQIVRSELGSKVEGVTRLTVTFGSNKQGGTVSIAD